MTEQRRIIYQIIMQSDDHPTAEMVYARAKQHMPSIALGTVYRNLKLMVDSGEIRHISMNGEPDRYDKTLKRHDHFVCVRCKKVFDCFTGDLSEHIANRTGIEVISYDLNIHCLCDDCRKLELQALQQ